MVLQHNSGGNGTSQKSVHGNQETETYVHWHLNSSIDFMTAERMTFDEFIAEQRKLSLQPKKPVSTINVVDQCGWADNMMCKINQTSQDFLLDQFRHFPEAVVPIKDHSISTRPSSSQAIIYCPSLTPGRATNNVIELGHRCSDSHLRSMQVCHGNEFGYPTLNTIRVAETIQVLEVPQLETFTSPLLTRMTLDDEPSLMSMI